MSNKIKLIIGGVVAAIVIIAGLIGFSSSPEGRGAEGDTNFTNVVASGYITSGGSITSSGTLTASGAFSVTGTSTLNTFTSYVSTGSFADATTTIFAVQNPYGATTTVDFAELFVTGASTSTIAISVATSTSQYPSSVSVGSLINSAALATSTLGYIVNGVTAGSTGFVSAGTAAQNRIIVGPTDYIVGLVTGSITGGVTNPSNTFAGSYLIRWNR